MNKKETPPKDEFLIRCPRLGHQINFSYCRIENNGLPCFKTLDCWYQHFEVESFLKSELSEQEWKNIFEKQTQPKMLSLLEMIEQAKKSKQKD
jgi:hypothetical protein